MKRREFITLLGGTAVAWPLAARAQQAAMPVVGFLSNRSPGELAHLVAAFHQGLGETGHVDGKDIQIAFRWGEGQFARLPALAADLIERKPAVIVAVGPGALAVKATTSTIPIVFIFGGDPVDAGLINSLNRPSENVTGVSWFSTELGAKRLGLMHELVPNAGSNQGGTGQELGASRWYRHGHIDLGRWVDGKAGRIDPRVDAPRHHGGVLLDPPNETHAGLRHEIEAAASAVGIKVVAASASSKAEIAQAFQTLSQASAQAVIVPRDGSFWRRAGASRSWPGRRECRRPIAAGRRPRPAGSSVMGSMFPQTFAAQPTSWTKF